MEDSSSFDDGRDLRHLDDVDEGLVVVPEDNISQNVKRFDHSADDNLNGMRSGDQQSIIGGDNDASSMNHNLGD